MTSITKITLTGYFSNAPTIESAADIIFPVIPAKLTDPYILTGVSGLGSPDVDVSISRTTYGGGVYQGSIPQDREIVLGVLLNPSYTSPAVSVDALRAALYRLMMGPEPVTIRIYTDSLGLPGQFVPRMMKASGYIKRIESMPFSKDPVVQITMRCPHFSFTAENYTYLQTPSLTGFQYNGTVAVGFQYDFTVHASIQTLNLLVLSPEAPSELMTAPGPFEPGDLFSFNTAAGSRSVKFKRPDDENTWKTITGLFTVMNNRWPALHPGSNTITVMGDLSELQITPSIFIFREEYWGV